MWDPDEPTSGRYEYGVARSAARRSVRAGGAVVF